MSEVIVNWPVVVMEWDKIYFNHIDLGNVTVFRMCLFKTTSPRLGMFVAIENKGAFFFSVHEPFHKDYIAEKLNLQGDEGNIADFLNAQLLNNHPQQGCYSINIINSISHCGSIGELQCKPWAPYIVKESANT